MIPPIIDEVSRAKALRDFFRGVKDIGNIGLNMFLNDGLDVCLFCFVDPQRGSQPRVRTLPLTVLETNSCAQLFQQQAVMGEKTQYTLESTLKTFSYREKLSELALSATGCR